MESMVAYIPLDRRRAMARHEPLPDRTNGAVLFADISGFTPLTEALVRQLGTKAGAEALTRQLNLVYDALINEVHRYGGSVIGFSGDAITCWFDDTILGHTRAAWPAVACAMVLQQTMAQFANVEIPGAESISLSLKVAVATGSARRFRVGDPYLQYQDVLAGATLDQMAIAEKAADKGEIVVTGETIAALGEHMVEAEWRGKTGVPPGQRLALVTGLRSMPATPVVDGAQPRSLGEPEIRPWLLPAVYERLRNGHGQFLAEIRPAVALFLRFGGIDYDRDEAAGDKLDRYIRWVQNVLARYEGNLLQLTVGDKGSYLYAAFGAPVAHGDDAVRAVAAALDLSRPLPGLDYIEPMQIGLSQGRMRTGAYGGTARRTYGVLGDEVNLAARLMQQAEGGQIVISEHVAKAVTDEYALEALEPVKVKGKAAPIPIWVVRGRRQPIGQSHAGQFAVRPVGREAELAALERYLATRPHEGGQIVRLEGPAGIGKSHLMAELIRLAETYGLRVAVGASQSISQGIPYYAWRQIFHTIFELDNQPRPNEVHATFTARQIERVEAVLNRFHPDWQFRLPLLDDLLGLPIADNDITQAFDFRQRQEALLALAVDMVRALALEQPLLLVLEDSHWLDEASQRMLVAIAQSLAQLPILLVLTHRPLPAGDETRSPWPELNRLRHCRHMPLGPLPDQGIEALVSRQVGGKVSPLAMALIQAKTHGNAFFVEELLDALRETGDLQQNNAGLWSLSEKMVEALRQANCLIWRRGEWLLAEEAPLTAAELGLPGTVQGLVLARLGHLPVTAEAILKVASVIGLTFDRELLARCLPDRPPPAALSEWLDLLEVRDFIYREAASDLVYQFKHQITHEVVYDTLLEQQQQIVHRDVGAALEQLQPEAVERLAHHFYRGQSRGKALRYLELAARKSQREYANETAFNYYSQALELEERWPWRQGQIEMLHILGRRDEERNNLQILSAQPEAPALTVSYLWSRYYEIVGDYAQAEAAIKQTLLVCQENGDTAGEVRCLVQLGKIFWRQGQYDQAEGWYARALEPFDKAPQAGGPGEYPPNILSFQNSNETHPFGQKEAGQTAEILQTFIEAFNGLGTVYRQMGDFARAQQLYDQALALSRQTNSRWGEADALTRLGITANYQRRFAEAQQYHHQALEIRQTIGDRSGEGASLSNLAANFHEWGDYEQAEEYLLAARAIQQATGNRWDEVNAWNDLGILYHDLGQLSLARAHFEQGLTLAREIGDEAGQAYLLSNLGLVLRDQGQLAAAEERLAEGLAIVQQQEDRYQTAVFLSYASTVSLAAGRLEEAIDRAGSALRLRQELGMRLLATDDLATLAKAFLALENLAEALAYARQALAILAECQGEGPEFPQRDYWICAQVLAAAGQPAQANETLRTAYDLVRSRAEKLTKAAHRRSFLEQAPVNRAIVAAIKGKVENSSTAKIERGSDGSH